MVLEDDAFQEDPGVMMTKPLFMSPFRARTSAAILAGALSLFAAGRVIADDASADVEVLVPASPVAGTLVICGGSRADGPFPEEVLNRFLALAGGPSAHLVVVTTASETADTAEVEPRIEFWRRAPLAELTILHTWSREVADDPKFSQPLATATGVWFIAGR